MPRSVLGARKVPVNMTLDPRLLAEVDNKAKVLELPRSTIISEALRLWLEMQAQETEIDRHLGEISQERLVDEADGWVRHDTVKAEAKL